MSYRELRNIGESLRDIGYKRLVSLNSFRTPNFILVEDIIRWFTFRYDPEADTLIGIRALSAEGEQQRVAFVRGFVEFMKKKTNLKLNAKRLYQADGYSVRELLKVIEFFNKAIQESNHPKIRTDGRDELTIFYGTQPSLTKIRKCRDLGSKLTEKGVTLFDLLSKEINLRLTRETVLNKPIDLKDYEANLQSAISALKQEQSKLTSTIESGENTINSINIKIQKKHQDLERNQQRWETMSQVRPAYMDEYEKIQKELEIIYSDYVVKYRILCHLQYQMDLINKSEENRRNEEKLARQESEAAAADEDGAEELIFIPERPITNPQRFGIGSRQGPFHLLGDGSSDLDEDDDEEDSLLDDSVAQNARDFLVSRSGNSNLRHRPQGTARNEMSLGGRVTAGNIGDIDQVSRRVTTAGRTAGGKSSKMGARNGNGHQVYGSMLGGPDDDDEEDGEDQSESDMLLLEGENSDLGSDGDLELENELMLPMRTAGAGTGRRRLRDDMPGMSNGTANAATMLLKSNHRPPPPVPTSSIAGSATNLDELQLKDSAVMNHGAGDSLTQPLQPEPRYTTIPAATANPGNNEDQLSTTSSAGAAAAQKPISIQYATRPPSRPGTGKMRGTSQQQPSQSLLPDDVEF